MTDDFELPKRKLPQILEISNLVDTDVFKIEQLSLQFANGEQRQYERFKQWPHGIVMVVPMLDRKHFLLIREYAAGLHDYAVSFPKGRVEAGETPIEAANRELQEEVGYAAKNMSELGCLTNSPGYSSTKMYIILAENLYESSMPGDEPEPIDVIPWAVDELDTLLQREDFHEARALAALFLLQKHLKG